ncbi:MAG: thioredoxin-disulfide reductase [Candidatus Dadabacteria bacterium]|nr:MAG: thioredoxin-disulfide reductase [Candidatus Dadabacteria bacterium]
MADTENNKHSEVLILGSGPAGYTAAIYTARANLNPLLISGPQPGGQLTLTTEVENYPGFRDGIMGPDLMAEMEAQAKRFGTEIIGDFITKADLSSRPFKLTGNSGIYTCSALIIATGASARLLGLDSEKELMGYGVSTCATCDGAFFRDKRIVVVGGGDSACEEALFLTKFGREVYIVHRRDELRASKIMAQRALSHEKITVLWNKVVVDIKGTKEGGVKEIILKDTISSSEEPFACDAVFIAIGHIPNTDIFKGQLEMDGAGYISTAPDSTKTTVEGVFACGDVQDKTYRQAITAAGSGCMAAIEVERWLAGHSE